MIVGGCSMEFTYFKDELELILTQNPTEAELYSILASLIRHQKNATSFALRDVSSRRISPMSKRFMSKSGFPDFIVMERAKHNQARIYGAIEIKRLTIDLTKKTFPYEKQITDHLETFQKVLCTNGLYWEYKSLNTNWNVSLGILEKGVIIWEEENWDILIKNLETINWKE